jgi:outer membrane protein TolC
MIIGKPEALFLKVLQQVVVLNLLCAMCVPAMAIDLDEVLDKPGNPMQATAPQGLPALDNFHTDLNKPENMVYKNNVYLLDFKSAIQLALRQSLTLEMMRSKTKSSTYAKREALAELLPDISLGYRQSRFQGGIQVFDGNPNLAYISTVLPEIKATLPINLAGQQVFNIKTREQQILVAEHLEQLVTDESLFYISSDYLNLLTQHLILQAAYQNLEESKAQMTFAKARYEEGLGVLLEVLEAQNIVDAQTRRVMDTKQEMLAANQRLNAQFGFPHQTILIPVMDSITQLKLYDAEHLSVEDIVQQGMSSSPRYKQAFHKLEGAKQTFKSVVASLFPTLTVSGYLNQVGTDFNNVIESKYGGFEVNLNVLEGLGVSAHSRVKQAQETLKQANLEYEQQKRDIEKDMAIEVHSLKKTAALLPIAKNQLLTAEEAKGQAWGRYKAGIGSYLELLQASSNLQNARTQYVGEQLEYKRQQLKLAYQLGELKNRLVAMGLPEMLNMPTQVKSVAASDAYANRPFKALQSAPEKAGYNTGNINGMKNASPNSSQSYAPPSLNYQPQRMMPGNQGNLPAMPPPNMKQPMQNVTGNAPYQHTHPMAPSYIKNNGASPQQGIAPNPQELSPQASRDLDELLEKVPAGYATPIQGYNR